MKHKVFILLLALLTFFSPVSSLAKTKLEIVWMGWPKQKVMQLIEEFEALHPDIAVDIQLVPFSQLFQTLEVRLSAGSTPDVYIVDGPLTSSYAARGNLLPLDGYFSKTDQNAWFPSSIKAGIYKGKLYSIPYTNSSAGLYFNKKIFQEKGIAFPSQKPGDRLTWERVAELAREFTEDKNRDGQVDTWGLVIEQIDRPYQLLPLAQSKGASAINPDGLSTKGCFTGPEFLEATTFYWRLFNEWKVSPIGLKDSAQSREYFGNNKSAMMLGAEWNISRLKKFKQLDSALAPHPYFSGGKPVTPTGSWHVGVNARTSHQSQAVQFVRFMTSKDSSITWHKLHGHAPARPDVYEALPEVFSSPMWKVIFYEMQNTAIPRPVTPGYLEYELILREAFNSIHFGADPQTALSSASKRIDRELAKYR